ncbi:MAG: DUF1211 domain-containing protein [Planctomycetes bacterium]|nr:DUF1211 domain-containing protein [Planctomycetota bacterium]
MDLDSLPVKNGFRMRGEAVTRLETLVDAAFAFALSMLVISVGTLPKDVPELFLALHRLPTFAACFLIVVVFWLAHNRWSRRYGLDDAKTTGLSLALVFTVLVFVFPLRIVMSGGMNSMTGGWVPSEMLVRGMEDLQGCFIVYGAGFCVLSAIIVQLNRIALKRGSELGLDAYEVLCTEEEIGAFRNLVLVGIASSTLAFFLRHSEVRALAGLPGFLYGTLGFTQTWHHRRAGARRRALVESGAVVRGGRVLTRGDID